VAAGEAFLGNWGKGLFLGAENTWVSRVIGDWGSVVCLAAKHQRLRKSLAVKNCVLVMLSYTNHMLKS
jgi:hypothetical protein